MIVLRKYKVDEVEKIKDILLEEKLDDLDLDGIVFVVIQDDEIVGVSKVSEDDGKWILNYLVISKVHRGSNLGDSLLRAILNKLANLEIEQVYFKSPNHYLMSRGFQQIDNKVFGLNIRDFFSKKCKGCDGSNVI